MIPHAGFRFGLAERLDMGLRLAPVPLPYATVGPGFGMNLDAKFHLSERDDDVQFAIIGGVGIAHVVIQETSRFAWSPNLAALTTFKLNSENDLTVMGRFVNLQIPTASGGSNSNFVNISSVSFGLRHTVSKGISILPEAGAYWYEGRIEGKRTSGPGFQYGMMIATSF